MLAVAAVLVLACVAAIVVVALRQVDGLSLDAGSTVGTAVAAAAETEDDPDDVSALRDVPPVSVVGPTWDDWDDTYTMDFDGWPFAFRVGGTWGSLGGTVSRFPDDPARGCVDERGGAGQRVNLVLQECPDGCTAELRAGRDAEWFDDPGRVVVVDEYTSYLETPVNEDGKYTVELSRYFGDGAGGSPTWRVLVYVESPPDTRAVVQAALNDVVTQTQ